MIRALISHRTRVRLLALFSILFLPGLDCGDDHASPKPALDSIVRRWSFHRLMTGAIGEERIGDERVQIGGVVEEKVAFGGLVLTPPGPRRENAEGEVFANENGQTYWVSAEAPHGVTASPGVTIGRSTELNQVQYFRKTAENASLSLLVSAVFLLAIDSNPGLPLAVECPWHEPGASFSDCQKIMWAWVSFNVAAYSFDDQALLLDTGGFAELFGFRDAFDYAAYAHAGSTTPFWNRASFDFDPDDEGMAWARLAAPISIEVPLASLAVGESFYVSATVRASTLNRRQRESFLSAYFRDPQQSDGVSMTYEGLERIETPKEPPAPIGALPAPLCDGSPDPEAGTLEFAAPTFEDAELPGDGATVVVRRSGGSRGRVSASFTATDGSAVAGSDYEAVAGNVLFADGEMGSRAVRIPLVVDELPEPRETLNLELSDPTGCAVLGKQSTATVTILDDDGDVTAATYTVGGTVTGLTGTGLVLFEAITGFEVAPTNGSFTVDYAYPDGTDYEVRVASQPVDPLQVCTVENASGTIAGADVTNVTVSCATNEHDGALDTSFGSDGKVTDGLPGGASAMALQPDGKLVIVGRSQLARYRSDGTLDDAFGSDGIVSPVFGGSAEEVNDVTLQSDGKIVVVGVTQVGGQDDFAVARYERDGSPDSGFGTAGKVSTDFAGAVDRAFAVRVQPDGKLVVAGHAATNTPLGVENDFAVARYDATGTLDASFGTGGIAMTTIAGRTDLAYAAVLQSDGAIVLAGRVAEDGGADPDVGLVRYKSDGTPDPAFGVQGIVRQSLGDWDEAVDLVIQPDGKLVAAVAFQISTSFELAIARFDSTGGLDDGFGSAGLATTAFSEQNDYARALTLQPDGRLVVVGQSSNLLAPDFAVARFDPEGGLDPSFGTDGKLAVDFFGAADDATCVLLQPDGKIVVGGLARNGTSNGLGLTRLLE